jgi:hypothetical protein
MEMLPAFALGLGFVAQFVLAAVHSFKPRLRCYGIAALFVFIVLNAHGLLRKRPLVYVEGRLNYQARASFDRDIPPLLRAQLARCPGSPVLMNTSVNPELVALAGISLRQTINEADRQIYRDALASPAEHAAMVLAFDGDEIDRAVKARPEGLRAIARFPSKQEAPGTLYISDSCPATR